MGVAEQREWFIKWQNCSSKERFQLIEYVERTVAAQETIEDDVDAWIPYWKWKSEQKNDKTESQMLDEWKALIESNKHDCEFRRGQWLLPRYEGFRRLSRKRMTQEQISMRKANVKSADEITALWASGQQILDRFAASRPVPMAHLADEGPHIEASVQDMPHTRPHQDAMLNAITREAYVYREPVRTQFKIF